MSEQQPHPLKEGIMSDARDWQPIETIPKGTQDENGDQIGPIVLVWLSDDKIPWTARWIKPYHQSGRIFSMYTESMGSWSVALSERAGYRITHWAAYEHPKDAP